MDRDHAPDPRLARHDSQADEFMGLPVRVWPDAPPHAIAIGYDIGRDDGTHVARVIVAPGAGLKLGEVIPLAKLPAGMVLTDAGVMLTRDAIAAARQLGKTQTAMHLAAARKPPRPLGFTVPVLAIGTLLAACALAAILITILEHLNR